MLIPHYYSVARLLPVIHDLTSESTDGMFHVYFHAGLHRYCLSINQDAIITLTQDNQSYF